MLIMYVGLFYMTSKSPKTDVFVSDDSYFNIGMFLTITILNMAVFYQWFKIIALNILLMVFVRNIKLFKLVTLNQIDIGKFNNEHFNNDT